MSGFLKNLFGGKSENDREGERLKEQSASWEEKAKLTETAESCYRRGKEYQRKGDLERARLYLDRASTLYSNFEQTFDESEVLMEDCDEQIGALEEEDLLYNELLEQVTERSEELSNTQNYIWGLLSLARFQGVFEKLSECPDCEILGELKKVLHLFCQGLGRPLNEEEQEYLQDFITRFYDFGDSEAFADTSNQIPVSGGKMLQVFDLNGNSTFSCMHIFMDKCIYAFCNGGPLEEAEPAETDFIANTVLIDHFLRTYEEELRSIPKVQEEIGRIWSDYDFVQTMPDAAAVAERMRVYQKMDML